MHLQVGFVGGFGSPCTLAFLSFLWDPLTVSGTIILMVFASCYLSCCLPNGSLVLLVQLVELEEFAAAVKENAEAVEERQETDSIPLVDDIRFHITSNVQTYSAIEEANQKLEALENLLASIGLEC